MTLTSGTKLGPYEIHSPLGAGGMGEVYRARDTRLDRTVAIKILPAHLSSDPVGKQRFEREAKTISSLNHPHICTLHDIGSQDGIDYLVMECVEGETLAKRLEKGSLPFEQVLKYGAQIADALDKAHRSGVVHRDLKPGNIMLASTGAKLLDFGLAKPAAALGIAATMSASARNSPVTEQGTIVGTFQYMSPEQVEGKELDGRSDIFSFGAVLYEMVTGKRAFEGKSQLSVASAILEKEPAPVSSIKPMTPPTLDHVIKKCLAKTPDERWQSDSDLASELKWIALEAFSGSSRTAAPRPALPASRRTLWGAILVIILALIALPILAYFVGRHSPRGVTRFEQVTFQRGYIKGARFTPDGQNVIYSAAWEGRPYEVFTARVGDRNARALDLKNAMVVGVSSAADIALLTEVRRVRTTNWLQVGTLARASLSGGGAREILEAVFDADISRDGRQFAVVRRPDGPLQLEYPIGKVLYKTNGYISHPRISPDGKQVAFLDHPTFGDDRGYVAVADASGNVRRLTREYGSEEGLAWPPDGREIWFAATDQEGLAQERAVLAVTTAGKVRKVVEVPGDISLWDIAGDGRLLFTHESVGSAQMLASPPGAPERNVSVLNYANFGAISSDGKAVAFTESGHGIPGDYLVFYRRLDGGQAVEIGEGACKGITPDGKFIVAAVPSQPTKLRIMPTGAGEARTFDVAPIHVDRGFVSWMPGAKEFVFQGHDGEAPQRGYRVSLEGGAARPLTNQTGAQFWNRVSPDGKSVLQVAGAGLGGSETVIVDLGTGQARLAPLQEGEAPIDWDQDGRHVFVVREADDRATIFRVDILSGRHEVWKEIRPVDPAGILSLSHFFVTPSGNAYAYSVGRVLGTLHVYSQK